MYQNQNHIQGMLPFPASFFTGFLGPLFAPFFDRRMWRIFLLGMMSGFPWVLIGTGLSLWLKEEGLSRSAVGFAGLVFSVYSINFLWAPFIDRLRIPILTQRLGHRKAWIISMQGVIVLAVIMWGFTSPASHIWLVMAVAVVIASCSATQDITIDALRIEQVDKDDSAAMATGASMAVIGWWTGFKLGGGAVLIGAEYFQNQGVENYWQMTFLCIAGVVILSNIGLILIPEKDSLARLKAQRQAQAELSHKLGADKLGGGIIVAIVSFLGSAVVTPLLSFFRHNGMKVGMMLLSFVFLFKIGEAFLGKMSIIFYKEVGFSKGDIAIYSKGLGWLVTVGASMLGGYVVIRSGIMRALLLAGVFMASTNLLFSALAWAGKVEWLFGLAVLLDDLAAALTTVVFVAFISMLVDRNYTATQYALLASVSTLGRTVIASSSGALVDGLGGDWGLFFIITAVMVIPSLVLLVLMRKRLFWRAPQEARQM